MSNSLQPHGLQHAWLPCPSLISPVVCSNSCPLSQWCHPTISSSVNPFSRGSLHCKGGGDHNHPKEKEMQEGKVTIWGDLTNSWEKTRSKGERERYTQLNAEFQRIARRDKKAFFNEQCKEIEEKNKKGKTRVLFKKIGDIKRIFHAKMGTIRTETVVT